MPIDIHGLQKRYENMGSLDLSSITESIKAFRATIQGRKKELLKPFGLDDLDKFKNNPEGFVKMVGYAMDSFAEKKEQAALYKKVYEDERCIITTPRGPEGAAAAGSMLKRDGVAVCPWCVAVKYPDNEEWWKDYNVEALFFVYAKENGEVTNAWCFALTAENCHNILDGAFSVSQIEDTNNKGNGNNPNVLDEHLNDLFKETGLDRNGLCCIFGKALAPRRDEIIEHHNCDMLFEAVEKCDIPACKSILKTGVNVEFQNAYEYDRTPLMVAALSANPEVCKMLLDAGADVNARNKEGFTPLMSAVDNGKIENCKLLIDAGADVNACDEGAWSVLIRAALTGKLEVCKMLLDAGAVVNPLDNDGFTPLMVAAHYGKTEVCRLFLNAGADVNVQAINGKTPLLWAVFYGYNDICKMLLEAGADVNARDQDGWTPLMKAAHIGYPEICKMLIDAGADINATNLHGMTGLMWGVSGDKTEICKMLIDAGADVNACDEDGWTALKLAARSGESVVHKLLLEAGAKM